MRVLIAIQEGQIPTETLRALEQLLRRVYAKHIGGDKLTIIWNVTAQKHGITDRQWSKSSAVSVEVPNGLDTATREAFLAELEKSWRAITGQHPDHLSIGAFDSDRHRDITNANLARLSAFGKWCFTTKLMIRLMISKRRHGLLIADFNQ